MDYKTKKILLIGFFVFIWLFIAIYIFREISPFQEEIIFPISQKEEQQQNIHKQEEKKEKKDEFQMTADDFLPENFNEITDGENKIALDFPQEQDLILNNENNTVPETDEEEVKLEIEMCGEFPCYKGSEFVELYNKFELQSGLEYKTKYIYNDKKVDNYIRSIAEERGYQRRVFADESKLVWFEKRRTQKQVRDNYTAMRNEMKKENISLHFVSAYRDSTHQRRIFKNKIGKIIFSKVSSGFYDKKIDTTLEVSAIPAYSKHHSGYAVDFGCGNDYLVYTFDKTECYDWLSRNNFEKAKHFGFIPSYPDAAEKQGPNPEPWEFVWVGSEFIKNNEFVNS